MMRRSLLATSLLGLCAFAGAPVAGMLFAPKEGSSLTKTFRTTMTMEVDSFEMLVNGEDQSGVMDGEDPSGESFEREQILIVKDEYTAVSGGRPTDLMRHYVSADVETSGGLAPEEDDEDVLQRMADMKVRFEWDDDEESYRKSYAGDEEGDEEDLEKLEADLDLLALLPEDEPEVGDSWSLPIQDLRTLLIPGNSSAMSAEDEDEMPAGLEDMITETFDGAEVTCTFEEIVDRDDVPHGVVNLEFAFEESVDLAEMILNLMEEQEGLPEGASASFDVADLGMDMAANGVLTWNLEAQRMASLTFEFTVTVAADLAAGLEMGGQVVADIEAVAEATITLEREVTVE